MALTFHGKDPFRRNNIIAFIRRQIFSGQWSPGEKLPPRTWFEMTFNASPHTVQMAFKQLTDAGLLVAEHRVGTRINTDISMLERYAVMMYGTEKLESFHSRSLFEATRILKAEGIDIHVFFDLNRPYDAPEHIRLYRNIHNHFYAGLFLEAPPEDLKHSNIFEETAIPITGYFSHALTSSPNHKPITSASRGTNNMSLIHRKMFHYLKECGATRIAAFFDVWDEKPEATEEKFREELKQFAMDCPPGYFLMFTPSTRQLSENPLRLLFSPHNTSFPDGIFINDDNYLPYVIKILVECLGKEKAEAITLVSIGNYPDIPHLELPVKYYGYNQLEILKNSIRFINDTRAEQESVKPPYEVLFETFPDGSIQEF